MNQPDRDALIEVLDLDREMLERVAHRTHQWGEAISNLLESDRAEEVTDERPAGSEETLRSEAASLFAIAGSYRMLLGESAARRSMLFAAFHFSATGSSFAYPLAICAQEPEVFLQSFHDLPLELTAQDRANALLALSWIDVTRGPWSDDVASSARELFHQHLDRAWPASQTAVGRMRIPLGAVAHALEAADRTAWGEEDPRRLSSALHDALMRMDDVTAAAMADRYHWRRLMSSVLPVEPEAAVLAGVVTAAARRADVEEELFERVDLPPRARVPLALGREMAEPEAA